MKTISIDLESFSSIDLAKAGVYKYASSPDFEILLFGYSVDGGDVRVVDLAAGETIPAEVLDALTDDSVIKTAHNSNFERVCLSRYLTDLGVSLDPFHDAHPLSTECARFLNPAGWHCTMVWAAYMGLPLSLADTGAVLGLEKQKLSEGKDLIRYFCKPCEPTKTNGGRTRNRPADAPEKWELFKSYNLRDVETEMEIEKRLSKFPVPEDVWDQYHIDQEINDRGIAIDDVLVENAIRMDARSRAELTEMMQKLTNLDNPNSVQQMKQWLINNGMEIDSLGKKQVQALLQDAPPQLREVLLLRQQLAKSSVKKYIAMKNAVCADGRVRGMFQFYGAVRSGRWAGRLVQLQNLYRNSMPDLEAARNLVREGDYDTVKMLYGAVPDVLAELIRTAFVPAPGKKMIVADFSAIEARVIAWLAGEQWRMDVFRDGGDIYCASASQMFKVPVEKHGVNGHLRQKGKIAELTLGYGGSVGALKAMGALDMGLSEDELAPLVKAWRESNPNIVKLWWAVDDAVMKAIRNKATTQTHGITFTVRSSMLFITLPSGRQLSYVKPRIGENKFGSQAATYMGAGSTRKWERIESYGPKFVENCIAAGTLVITDHGCVPIEQVQPYMRVWDGQAFVHHGGLVYRGHQKTFSINGIHMTPDHKILTTEGWVKCVKADNRFDWTTVSLPDGFEPGREYCSGQDPVAVPVHMRKRSCCSFQKFEEEKVSNQVLRVHDANIDIQGQSEARHGASSRLGCMAFYETTLHRPEPSCLSQLRRTWNNGLQSLAGKLRGFLERHGADLEKRTGSGSHRQQSRLQSRELPMDIAQRELSQQEEYAVHHNAVVDSSAFSSIRTERHWEDDAPVSSGSRVADRVSVHSTGMEEAVYDLLNCGPRHRFAVWDGCKARIVSNCVQAISRDILCYAMQTLRYCRIVAHVHDELIIEADPAVSLDAVCEQMGRTPPWAEGLLLRADGYECAFYQKD